MLNRRASLSGKSDIIICNHTIQETKRWHCRRRNGNIQKARILCMGMPTLQYQILLIWWRWRCSSYECMLNFSRRWIVWTIASPSCFVWRNAYAKYKSIYLRRVTRTYRWGLKKIYLIHMMFVREAARLRILWSRKVIRSWK